MKKPAITSAHKTWVRSNDNLTGAQRLQSHRDDFDLKFTFTPNIDNYLIKSSFRSIVFISLVFLPRAGQSRSAITPVVT